MKLEELNICRLNIQLTKKCNQRCKMCNSYNLIDDNLLSKEKIFKLINDACENYNIKNIAFTGGEPTLREDFLQVVKFAKMFSGNVSITTNASYIKTQEDAFKLIESGINRFTISYHGIGTHSNYVGINNAEENTKKAINYLKTANKDILIKIGMLLTNKTIDNIYEMINYCKKMGVILYLELPDDSIPIFENDIKNEYMLSKEQKLKVLKFLNEAEINNYPILISKSAKKYIEYYLNKKNINGPCPLGYTDIYVSSEGEVYTGCWGLDSIGNINSSNIVDIMNSDKYKENIEKMLKRECLGCTCGYLFQSNFMTDYNK